MTLTQLFTAIANEIRRIKGTVGTIVAENFPDEMADINTGNLSDEEYEEANDDLDDILENTTVPSGTISITENGIHDVTNYVTANIKVSGSSSVSTKDVNFYDYDGTIIEAYTKNEFLALESMPENPSHRGLTSQGWNWTLADAKSYVTNCGKLNIGQMYITDDGKTRLYIHIETNERMNVPLCFRQSVTNGIEVDWGDESPIETFAGSGSTNILPTHQYSTVGDYVITLNPINDCQLTLGSDSINYGIIGVQFGGQFRDLYLNRLIKVEIGKNVTSISQYAFYQHYLLSRITIPNSVTSISTSAFYQNYILPSITLPNSITSIGANAINYCYSLSSVIMPNSINGSNIGESAFSNCNSLITINVPSGITFIRRSMFNYCSSLSSVTIPNGVTEIAQNVFSSCYSLTKIIIPNSVRYIDGAFLSCVGMSIYDFSKCTQIPSLLASNAFMGIPSDCKIIVPNNLYNDWIAASVWSNYANYIVKASEV